MNEKLTKGQEMLLAGLDRRKGISVIMERMLETRPKEEVSFRPFLACRYVGYTRTLSSQKVRLGDMQNRETAFLWIFRSGVTGMR